MPERPISNSLARAALWSGSEQPGCAALGHIVVACSHSTRRLRDRRGSARTGGVRRSSGHEAIATAISRYSQAEVLQFFINAKPHDRIGLFGAGFDLPPFAIFAES